MTDKILKEAYDRLTVISEDSRYDEVLEGIDELQDIQESLFELIDRLDGAIRTYLPQQHAYWQSYGLAHLKIIAGSDEYASNDESISKLIQKLHDESEAPDGEDEYEESANVSLRNYKRR